ncbi:MAG: hypothetical protein AAF620_15160 [Bacteroidota bacterium]
MRKMKALVPVRSGSVRVENKNIRPFCGSTLLEIKIGQLQRLSFLDDIVVSSNDDYMLSIAKRMGAKTHDRNNYFASNTVSMSEVYENMASSIDCDDILYALVTTPLVTDASFEKAYELYRKLPKGYDSLATIEDVKEFLIKDGKPFNYDANKIPRSQDLPDIFKLTFCISMLSRQAMVEKKSCLGLHPYFLKLSQQESIDIDTHFDFKIAEFLYQEILSDRK